MSPRPTDAAIKLLHELLAERARTDPEFRAVMSEPGAAGYVVSAPVAEWPAMLAALRALPDDAGRLATNRALAPWNPPGEQGV